MMAHSYSTVLMLLPMLLAVLDEHYARSQMCSLGNTLSHSEDFTLAPASVQGEFLDLQNPASCDGTLTSVSLCFSLLTDSQEPQQLLLRVWRSLPGEEDSLQVIGEIPLSIEPSNQLSGGECTTREIEPRHHVDLVSGDVLGVVLNQDLPFAVISEGITASGLHQHVGGSSPELEQLLAKSNLTLRANLTLNIHARFALIEPSIPILHPSPSVPTPSTQENLPPSLLPVFPMQASIGDQINTIQPSLAEKPVHSTFFSAYLPTPPTSSLSTPPVTSTKQFSSPDVSVLTVQSFRISVTDTVPHDDPSLPDPGPTQTSGLGGATQSIDVEPTSASKLFASTETGFLPSLSLFKYSTAIGEVEMTHTVGPDSTAVSRLPLPTPPARAIIPESTATSMGIPEVVMTASLGNGMDSSHSALASESSLFGLASASAFESSLPISFSTQSGAHSMLGLSSFTMPPESSSVETTVIPTDTTIAPSASLAGESTLIPPPLASDLGSGFMEAFTQDVDFNTLSVIAQSSSSAQIVSNGFSLSKAVSSPESTFPSIAPSSVEILSSISPSTTTLSSSEPLLSPPLPSVLPTGVQNGPTSPQPSLPSTETPPTESMRVLTGSLVAVTVAVCFLFATFAGCVMTMVLYITYCRKLGVSTEQISSRGKIGMDNPSYFVKQRDDSVSALPILSAETVPERPNQLNVSLDSNNGSNDNVAWNAPFAERNSSQRSISRPATAAVTRNLSFAPERSEAEVIEMENYLQEPVEITHNTNYGVTAPSEIIIETCNIDIPQAVAASSKTLTLCSRHDYEEVTLDALAKERRFNTLTRDHVYDEPDEMEPGFNSTEARGYEEPVTRNWKRLSLPSLDNPSLNAVSQQIPRRNSSASELTSSGSFNPRAKKPGRILHYAEFSLYPGTQSGALPSVSETTVTEVPTPHKMLSPHSLRQPQSHERLTFGASHLRQVPARVPAPTRLLRGRSMSDYEVPVVTSPSLLRAKSTNSVMQQVKRKLHHLSANMSSGGNINDEQVQLIESESEGRGDEGSDALKSPENEGLSSSPDTNSSNSELINGSALTMDGAYFFPSPTEEELQSALKKLSIEVIPRNSIECKTNDQVQHGLWRKDVSSSAKLDVTLKSVDVADSEEEIESNRTRLLQEVAIMGQFRHPNILRLYGVVDEERHTVLVSEYFPRGDLRKILVQMGRSVIPSDTPKLLLMYSQQIALGMQYLASKGFVHRDLCARNVFITDEDICKIGGFGKSRDLTDVNDYIIKGGRIQVRWTAPEAMYYRQYSTASDVWSYGCLLYEIWSLGRMPFRDITNAEVIEKVDSGYRLPPPPGCPLALYNLMIQCWHPNPFSRPCFKDIINTLLRDEERVLQIPIRDASTHESAIILGANLKAGTFMYSDLQQRYTRQLSRVESISSKKGHHDYDHIQEDEFMFTFPTSSADLGGGGGSCSSGGMKNKMAVAAKMEDIREGVSSGGVSLVPQPSIYSTPVECDRVMPFTSINLRDSMRRDRNINRADPRDYEYV